MSDPFAQRKLRIHTKGMQADDIHHEGLLEQNQIQDIPLEKVYEWVRTGKWKQKHFLRWAKAVRLTD